MQQGHPVAYLSKALCPKNQALSTYEKECLAILMAVNKWRPYLQQQHFVIRTDQQALLHLTEQRLSTGIQHKAFVKLMGLDYTIQYKKGLLTRRLMLYHAVSMGHPCWRFRQRCPPGSRPWWMGTMRILNQSSYCNNWLSPLRMLKVTLSKRE